MTHPQTKETHTTSIPAFVPNKSIDNRSDLPHNMGRQLFAVEASAPPGDEACSTNPAVPPLSQIVLSEQVRLIDGNGAFVRLIDSVEAHRLIRERHAVGLGSRKTIRAVQLVVTRKAVEDDDACRPLLPSGLVGQRYSHKHDTDENPENVWTLKRLSSPDAKTDLFVHLAHIDSVLACLSPRERAAMIHGLGLMRGLRAKDVKQFVESAASAVTR